MFIESILVPVDFSPPSTLAVNYGIALARKFHAKLNLLHVVEEPAALMYTFPTEAEKVERQRAKQAKIMLPALAGAEDLGNLAVEFIVRSGGIEATIESVCSEKQVALVVMGTNARGLFGRIFIGSVAEGLLRKLTVPILTVGHVSHPLEFKSILFAADFGDASTEGFRFALDLAGSAG